MGPKQQKGKSWTLMMWKSKSRRIIKAAGSTPIHCGEPWYTCAVTAICVPIQGWSLSSRRLHLTHVRNKGRHLRISSASYVRISSASYVSLLSNNHTGSYVNVGAALLLWTSRWPQSYDDMHEPALFTQAATTAGMEGWQDFCPVVREALRMIASPVHSGWFRLTSPYLFSWFCLLSKFPLLNYGMWHCNFFPFP